jgi:hypothetical protein
MKKVARINCISKKIRLKVHIQVEIPSSNDPSSDAGGFYLHISYETARSWLKKMNGVNVVSKNNPLPAGQV